MMPSRIDARTQPCLTPLWILKVPEVEPSYWIVSFVSFWKVVIMLRIFVRKPIPAYKIKGLCQVNKGNVNRLCQLVTIQL